MSDSKQWALDELQKANTIFEPDEPGNATQLMDWIIYMLEWGLIWFVASRFVAS